MNNNDQFKSMIHAIVRLHAPTFDHSNCSECNQAWPCKTIASVNSRGESLLSPATEEDAARSLGLVLSELDNKFDKVGVLGANLVDAFHQLVLIPELVVTGSIAPETSFEVSLRINRRQTILLWKLELSARPLLQVNASIDAKYGKQFLSQVLTESFTPIEADEVLEWWRKIPQSSSRAVMFELPDNEPEAINLLSQLCRASALFSSTPVQESFNDSSDIYL